MQQVDSSTISCDSDPGVILAKAAGLLRENSNNQKSCIRLMNTRQQQEHRSIDTNQFQFDQAHHYDNQIYNFSAPVTPRRHINAKDYISRIATENAEAKFEGYKEKREEPSKDHEIDGSLGPLCKNWIKR